ncbi:hypothetical protein AK812_SmicGene44717, partial [Symbiodinium microadriaticum]
PKAKARLSGRGPRSPRARKRAAPSPGGKRRLGRGRPRSPGQPPPARERWPSGRALSPAGDTRGGSWSQPPSLARPRRGGSVGAYL